MHTFNIPLHVEKQHLPSRPSTYVVCPLFYPDIKFYGNDVEKVIAKVRTEVMNLVKAYGSDLNHKNLAQLITPPLFKSRRGFLEISFRRTKVNIQSTIYITINMNGKRVAFTPLFPDIWFECGKNRPENIASEIISKEVKKLEKQDKIRPNYFERSLNSHHWIHYLEVGAAPKSKIPKATETEKFFLGFSGEMDGEAELSKVGRNLDDLYPDNLDRVRGCYREVEKVFEILNDINSQPALLLGPNCVGKTGIINEANFQKIQLQKNRWTYHNKLYLVSPQRIISGMSYVGQWESRILAILDECRLKDHVLYFDNLPGLFTTSTGSNTMTIAHVLKPEIEKGKLRIIAEATQEELNVVQEKDRTFAELFNIIHVREPDPASLMDIMLETCRDCEADHKIEFDLNVLPTVLELTRRYQRHLAYPGKSVTFVERLALKKKPVVMREDALNYFKDQCGLSLNILDSTKSLEKKEIVEALSDLVIGQEMAVEAMADAVVRCKARMSDPDKPLASYLFAGPTGVGKTECAKALAITLFNSEDRLIRFDMNEFKSPDAVSRLAGNPWQPEGLLTSAIRNRPFSVVLLDELEKAHHSVFDLLLQLLGEGRLTDSLGRTADFTNAIIIMTSNLGSREASQSLGFNESDDPQTYLSAVKRFFKPEFFNRLDKVIPFDSLNKTQIRGIAGKMVEKVLQREGLKRRQCILDIGDGVIDLLVEHGYSMQMGARSMKRAVEREVSAPVAAQLVPIPGGTPLMLRITRKEEELQIESTPFSIAESAEVFELENSFPEVKEELEGLLEYAEDLTGEIEDWNQLKPSEYHSFNMKDRIDGALIAWNNINDMLENDVKPRHNPFSKFSEPMTIIYPDSDISVFFSSGVRNYTRKCLKNNPVFGSELSHRVKSLVCYSYLLDLLVKAEESEVTLEIKGLSGKSSGKEAESLVKIYESFFEEELHLQVKSDKNKITVSGFGAKEIVNMECGIHLFYSSENRPLPVLITDGNIEKLKVIRAYTPDGGVFDFRSMLLTKNRLENWQLMRFISYASVFCYEEEENG